MFTHRFSTQSSGSLAGRLTHCVARLVTIVAVATLAFAVTANA